MPQLKYGWSVTCLDGTISLGDDTMPRPKKLKIVHHLLESIHFRPLGKDSGRIVLELEELEAIRLADYEGLYQEDAARQMGISRQTFGRLLSRAHRKVADALLNKKVLTVEQGNAENFKVVKCKSCGRVWRVPKNFKGMCPSCLSCSLMEFKVASEGER